jgi:hypothetical protein
MEKELATLSGLEEEVHHCCINSCVLFTGEFEDCQNCPICEEPQLDGRKKPCNVFRYLPLQPRLQALFKWPKMLEKLQYRKNMGPFTDTCRCIFDSEHFRTLLQTKVVVDGTEYPHKMGKFDTDIFIGFGVDGAAVSVLGNQGHPLPLGPWPSSSISSILKPELKQKIPSCSVSSPAPNSQSTSIPSSPLSIKSAVKVQSVFLHSTVPNEGCLIYIGISCIHRSTSWPQ